MTSNDFVSVDHILAEVSTTVNDPEYNKGFSEGWYTSRIQDAMQELSFDTFWRKELLDYEIPEDCRIKLPTNVFNLREIYLYTGEICNPLKSQIVYWKRLFNNSYSGQGYTAQVKDDGSNGGDIYQPNQRIYTNNHQGYYGPKYYYNIFEGVLMLSQECKGYPYIRLVFNSMGVENGNMPIIPRFFERAVVDYVKVKFYEAMKARDPRMYRPLWSDAKQDLENLTTGSWNKARKRIKSMDSREKASMEEYISSMYHK
ncbi:MAG: hypothetical protein ACPGSG_02490 [Prolixibacteraceae bacterium]